MSTKVPEILTARKKELKALARKLKKDPDSFKQYKNFSTGYMNGKSLTPKQIQVFTFYTATRILFYDWWEDKNYLTVDIASYLMRFLGVSLPSHFVRDIYFKIFGELHPKGEEWSDCGTSVYGHMCGYF
jgi:hypothetical protein